MSISLEKEYWNQLILNSDQIIKWEENENDNVDYLWYVVKTFEWKSEVYL